MKFNYSIVKENDIPAGANIVAIGNPEKTRVFDYVRIQSVDGVTVYYRFFYEGSLKKLITACDCLVELTSGKKLSSARSNQLYKTLFSVLYTVHHVDTATQKSKLAGINSLSTSCLDNYMCLRRMQYEELICSSCYAETQQKYQHGTAERNIINGIILKNVVIPVKAWKTFYNNFDINSVFRFESFGDISNLIQVENYCNMCRAFPKVRFAAWTKNVFQWCYTFDRIGKPKNLSFVVSSPIIGKTVSSWIIEKWGGYIDHVFTVYKKGACAAINCGGRKCMDCIKKRKGCYYRKDEKSGGTFYINEELK